jgi:hypothetical protein
VSSRKRKTTTAATAVRATDHQYSTGQYECAATKPPKVGPADAPKFSARCRTVKARPLWCKKNMSTRYFGPSMLTVTPKKAEK